MSRQSSLDAGRSELAHNIEVQEAQLGQRVAVLDLQRQSEPQPPRSFWAFIGSILLTDLGIHALSSYVATSVFHADLHLETAFQGDQLAQLSQGVIFVASLIPGVFVGGVVQQFVLHPIYGRSHDSWSNRTQGMADDIKGDFGDLAETQRSADALEAAYAAAEHQRVRFQHPIHFGRPPKNYNPGLEN